MITFGASLLVYLWTMAPTITYGGDCGDFISASYTLRNCHPTGYPLYLLLGKLVSAIPMGEVAARYNFLSALFAAIAVALVAAICFRLTANAVASATAGLSLAFFHFFWSQAVITEVYTMAAASDAILILLLLTATDTQKQIDWRRIHAYFLASGFAFTHHLSALFVFVPGALFIAYTYRPELRMRHVATGALMFCVPLLLYSYLPMRSSADPAINHWGDLTTPSAMFAHATGRLYRSHMFALTLAQAAARGTKLLTWIAILFLSASAPLLIGLVAACFRRPRLAVLLISMAGLNLAVDLPYDVGDWIYFFFPTYVVCAVFIGIGGDVVTMALRKLFAPVAQARLVHAPLLMAVPVLLLIAPVSQLCLGFAFGPDNLHKNRHAFKHAEEALSQTESRATLFVKSDELLFTSWYFQRVLGRFRDRRVVSITKIGGGEDVTPQVTREVLKSAASTRTFVAFWMGDALAPYHVWPRGRVCEIRREGVAARPLRSLSPDVQLLVGGEAKRDFFVPLMLRWKNSRAVRAVDVAFILRGSAYDPPRGELPGAMPLTGGATVNLQIVGWREQRLLHPSGAAEAWEEPLACEVPGNALPGQYNVYVRLRDGRGSRPWLPGGQTNVIDL